MTGIDSRRGGPIGDGAGRRGPHDVEHDTEPLAAVPPSPPPADRPGPDRGASDRPSWHAEQPPTSPPAQRESRSGGGGQPPERSGRRRSAPPPPKRRGPLLALLLCVLAVAVGGVFVYQTYFVAPDYDGPGEGDVVIQVHDGDPTVAIAAELVREDVVRSSAAFVDAAEDNSRVRAVQPGYYRMRLRSSGEDAVAALVDPASRVGQLEIKGGVQLDDTRGPDGRISPGVLSLISKASCVTLNGANRCASIAQLRGTMATSPLAQLGVPAWATGEISRAAPERRLEGFIAPGRYDVQPGASAQEILRSLVRKTATQYEAGGLVSGAESSRYSPYQLLVIASLVEKEGITPDFGKVAGVIYNRLSDRIRLGLDSTVNYPLDLQAVRTNASDRNRSGPYNSYLNYGLPPTPIGAPGQQAIQAALRPTEGPWMYFVRCQRSGVSCFSTTLPEHEQNVKAAVAAGAF